MSVVCLRLTLYHPTPPISDEINEKKPTTKLNKIPSNATGKNQARLCRRSASKLTAPDTKLLMQTTVAKSKKRRCAIRSV
jgi:hypothetical protein